jgi:hypothetical protein
MTPLFKKMNLKNQTQICVLNSPESFEIEIKEINKTVPTKKTIAGLKQIDFIVVFVQTEKEIEYYLSKTLKLFTDDTVCWFAYPKGTSKKYKPTINRDNGWEILGENGFETVRAVAIDEDWSGLRFKKADKIKILIRNEKMALSKIGKSRINNK